MVEFMVDMGPESLNGAKNGTPESGERADVLSRAKKVVEMSGQPSLVLLYEVRGRPFPSDNNTQDTLMVFYAARLCLGLNGGLAQSQNHAINGVRLVRLDEVLQGDSSEERMKTAKRLRREIDFVRDCTPTPLSKMPSHLDPLSVMGITGDDRRRFARELGFY